MQRQSKKRYREMKYYRCEYAETRQAKSNVWNSNTAAVDMQRRGKQIKIYRTERLQMLIWRHDESKV